ncbi:MFS transporter [Nitratireductor basaltis]|uniref:Major facilitator superfamily protein n=1 Tax=Nitratireductor basaltis TaxID=472175 RepID=A0A084U5I4_9HYPH|nr:MFS transporter [Nitratireductor basaltis]KFB08220.1 Major facilitator superfamily protein [Nitratireductor basaltis]
MLRGRVSSSSNHPRAHRLRLIDIMTAASAPRGERRFINMLGAAQICSWGTIWYGFPLIAEAMRGDLGWTKTEIYAAATLGMLLASLAAYPVGAAIDRGHGRKVMAGASIAAGLLLALWSQVDTLWLYYPVLAFLGCTQAAVLYEPAFAVVTRRVGPTRARGAITALTLWGGFASTVFIPLIQYLIDTQGWRGALLAMAGVNIVICGTLYARAIDPDRDAAPVPLAADEAAPLAGRAAVRAAMRLPAYWGLMVAWISYVGTFSALTYHFYPLLLERGLDAAATVMVLTVIGPAQVAGRIAVRALAHDLSVRQLGSAIVIVFPLVVIGFAYAPPNLLIIACLAAGYGAANGMTTIIRGAAIPEMVTRHAYGAVNGSIVAPMTVMQALAPLGAALLWQATGSYGPVLAAIFIGSLTFCAGFWFAALRSRPPVVAK